MNNKVNVMDIEKAIGNVYELISGVNPITNESLKDTELYCDDEMLETFALCIKGLEFLKTGRNPNLPEKSGGVWTKKEIEQLIEEYQNGMSIDEIAEIHKRTRGGIRSRLRKLYLLD